MASSLPELYVLQLVPANPKAFSFESRSRELIRPINQYWNDDNKIPG